MKLWLVRHAQPCIAPGRCYGALDVPADPLATQRSAHALAAELPTGLHVQVSPLQRCELLAQCLRGLRPDLTFETEARLAEMNFGKWEGVPWADIPQAAMEAWTADFGNHRFGGMESANKVLQRVAAAWAQTLQNTRRSGAADAVWITHAGVARAMTLIRGGVMQVENAAQWPDGALGYGEWRGVGR